MFEQQAANLRRALEASNYEDVRALMWNLGLSVTVDFGEADQQARADSARKVMERTRLGEEKPETHGAAYEPYALPA